ncbi:MAG TPA: methyltransferase domain-containing protein [Candidatus Binatia bacterium]|nr:methyltransferase domain-containing protein [Candidatus Binatia bacterium]
MYSDPTNDGLLRYVRARWPTYVIGFGGGFLLALWLVVIGAGQGRWWLVVVALAALLVLAYFFTMSLWSANEQFNRRHSLPATVIFELGQIQPTDDVIYVGLGLRDTPIRLSRRLTRGQVQAVDVYNPQLAPGAVLARQRRPLPNVPPDPRLIWLEGSIGLLPLPDNSAHIVACSYTLVELWQHGDRQLLLREMRRVLQPGGHLLLAEPVRTRTQFLTVGPAALRLPGAEYWRRQLAESGFNVVREHNISGFYTCFRAEKPLPGTVQQLALDLGI